MKSFFGSRPVAEPSIAEHQDCQTAPTQVMGAEGKPVGQIKIDLAIQFDGLLCIAGWSTKKAKLSLVVDGQSISARKVSVARPDVAIHFGLESGDDLGFVLVAKRSSHQSVSLGWQLGGQKGISKPLQLRAISNWSDLAADELALLRPSIGLFALVHTPFTPSWTNLVANIPPTEEPCADARGFLEGALLSEKTGEAIVYGWVVGTQDGVVWLEDDAGQVYSLQDAYRRFRQDVHDAVGKHFGHASREAGFLVRVRGIKVGSKIQLKAISETGIHVLSVTNCSSLPIDPVGAARTLFGLATPLADLHRRIPVVDEPILGPLIDYQNEIVAELPVTARQLGQPVANPVASVIVPLYGRTDFVEHQLIEFSADPWFSAHAELIYVLDDPNLLEPFAQEAESLYKLYRLPFKWVWGSINRGYAGANNLGASQSNGKHLVFLNSDAFPQRAGWLDAMLTVLGKRPDIGAVGPRLVFADGSIQHAGMEFLRREELGVWVNHHPLMGLDPALDPHRELAIVPSVTGACMAMRRVDFERIGGWNTGYLIGDFEDSDLCMKLRSEGLKCAYLPTVQLTHLERQSLKLLGQDEFRSRVVIFNAVRHQRRWEEQIQAASTADRVTA